MSDNKEIEIWKPIPDVEYEDLYEISNLGNYRNKSTSQLLKPFLAGKYMMASLSKPGRKLKRYLVHRLVACAFVDDPDDDPDKNVVNHIDGNKFNNASSNLEWTTLSQNSVHARQVLKQRKTNKKIISIDNDGIETEYESIIIAARQLNIRRQYITECARGQKDQIAGYKWKYADVNNNAPIVDLATMKKISDYEEFKKFPGYYINEYGQIYGKNKSQYLIHNITDGYPKIMLYCKAQPKCYYVHVLVAKIFIPNPDNKPIVDHIDNDKTNCHVSNLRWVNHSENANNYFEFKKNLSVLSDISRGIHGSVENTEVEVESDKKENPDPISQLQ